jgi:hypothetical protein
MVKIKVEIVEADGELVDELVDIEELYLAGYTGRNRELVRMHILELQKLGVPAPKSTPIIMRVSPYLLTTGDKIEVVGDKTSGEVEYVLLIGDDIYVTVGSDHTDRWLEKSDIQRSKQLCPKIIAPTVWRYNELREHWDKLIIRSYVVMNNRLELYQEGFLEIIIHPERLLEIFDLNRKGVALFSGTIPLKRDLCYTREFIIEMEDPILNRKITHRYMVNFL